MADEVSSEELELLDGTFAELRTFGVELLSREGWFPQVLTGLLNATLREYQHLKTGWKHSTAMSAWACGNLMNLHIYTRYVLIDEAHATRLVEERLRDAVEAYDSFRTWLARNDPDLIPTGVEDGWRSLMEEVADVGISEIPPLKLKRMAAEVGLADEHANMTRLNLALAQPNAFSILGDAEPEAITMMRPTLYRAGAGHGLEIFRLIKDEAAKLRMI